jgi:predicted lipoprotein with Yx(FWY)xxD motif
MNTDAVRRQHAWSVVLAAPVVALALGACGSSDDGGGSSAAKTVSAKQVSGVGSVLVDSRGRALYTPEQEARGKILCTGECLSFWQPLVARSGTPTGAGNLGVVRRPDGKRQVTRDGKPLYTFSEDSRGKVTGDGFKDDFGGRHFVWHAVLESGSTATAPQDDPSQDSSGYSGY